MKLSHLDEFLQFGRPVRIAFTGLLGFSIAFLLLPFSYPYIFSSSEQTDFSETEMAANAIIEKVAAEEEHRKTKYAPRNFKSKSYYQEKASPPKSFKKKKSKANQFSENQLFEFDPNTVDEAALIRLGFSERVARTFLNYRSKGAFFRKKEDFKKVYGVSETDYLMLEPFITIPKSTPENTSKTYEESKTANAFLEKPVPAPIKIDINQATEEDWQTLRGIGPYYAEKIVEYRDKLGGFSSIEQIGSTYGLKDSTFQIIKSFLEVSPITQKMKINSATWDELKNHPYIKGKQARVIEKYRQNHGAFADFEAFKKVVVFPEKELEKLRPYLDFSEE